MSFRTRSGRQAGQGAQQTTYARQQQQNSYQTPYQPVYSTPLSQPGPPGAGASPQPQPVVQQQPQQQQSPAPAQFKMEQTSPATPVKPSTPQVQPQQIQAPMDVVETVPKVEVNDGEEPNKPWKKHKHPTFKVNKVQKRRRQNARFRKLLIPKNAIMVLNELNPGCAFETDEQTNAFAQTCYTVRCTIDGDVYSGEGPSKTAAKAAAAECAVKGLILKKISEAGIKKMESKESLVEDESMDSAEAEDGSTNGRRPIPEDEVPWGSLASFALFKLFADWKSQGSSIPTILSPPQASAAAKPIVANPPGAPPAAAAPGAKKASFPEGLEALHPVTIVGRMFPGTVFTELSREGTPPHLTFSFGATVNDVNHVGVARSKKEAKKNCAIEILKANNLPYNPCI